MQMAGERLGAHTRPPTPVTGADSGCQTERRFVPVAQRHWLVRLAPPRNPTVSFCSVGESQQSFGGASMKRIWQQWWRLPLLVGVGALFNYGARATVPHGSWNEADDTTTERLRRGEVLLKFESDNIYFSEDAGRTYHELELTAT